MIQTTAKSANGAVDTLIRDCAAALEKVASYKLPSALNRRLLWLSENKEKLTENEREELLALIDLSEDRTIEKLHANVILRRFKQAWPQLFEPAP